jgi:hypothetical protein
MWNKRLEIIEFHPIRHMIRDYRQDIPVNGTVVLAVTVSLIPRKSIPSVCDLVRGKVGRTGSDQVPEMIGVWLVALRSSVIRQYRQGPAQADLASSRAPPIAHNGPGPGG